MNPSKTKSALRASLQQEEVALAERLPGSEAAAKPEPSAAPAPVPPAATAKKPARKPKAAPATPPRPRRAKVAAATAPAPVATGEAKKKVRKNTPADTELKKEKADKPEKVVRDSFSMPASENARLKALRLELAQAGRLATKSEVLRAGLHLLGRTPVAELVGILDALPVVAKGKRSKKH